jgi:hypothetical protein
MSYSFPPNQSSFPSSTPIPPKSSLFKMHEGPFFEDMKKNPDKYNKINSAMSQQQDSIRSVSHLHQDNSDPYLHISNESYLEIDDETWRTWNEKSDQPDVDNWMIYVFNERSGIMHEIGTVMELKLKNGFGDYYNSRPTQIKLKDKYGKRIDSVEKYGIPDSTLGRIRLFIKPLKSLKDIAYSMISRENPDYIKARSLYKKGTFGGKSRKNKKSKKSRKTKSKKRRTLRK